MPIGDFFDVVHVSLGAWLAFPILLRIQQIPLFATITGRNSFDLARYFLVLLFGWA